MSKSTRSLLAGRGPRGYPLDQPWNLMSVGSNLAMVLGLRGKQSWCSIKLNG